VTKLRNVNAFTFLFYNGTKMPILPELDWNKIVSQRSTDCSTSSCS